jgi:hypothetical protein
MVFIGDPPDWVRESSDWIWCLNAQTKSPRRGQYGQALLQCGISQRKAVDRTDLLIEQSVRLG